MGVSSQKRVFNPSHAPAETRNLNHLIALGSEATCIDTYNALWYIIAWCCSAPALEGRNMKKLAVAAATLLAVLDPTQATAAGGFVNYMDWHDFNNWYRADGWVNPVSRCGWNQANTTFAQGFMKQTVTNVPRAGKPYSCGLYQSRRKFGYGRYQTRMKAARGSGVVSGIFTYTAAPQGGGRYDEIDFEFLGRDTTKLQTNYFVNGGETHEKLIALGFDAASSFHTYAYEWRPDSIEWFVDGRSVRKVTRAMGPLPSHPGKISALTWATSLRDWAGPFRYREPIVAEYDYIRYTPLAQLRGRP
jgi:endo-1,3-1,4-beta-glycanase ExoK